MTFIRKMICIIFLVCPVVKINAVSPGIPSEPSSLISNILFYTNPCYALSIAFDAMHSYDEQTSSIVRFVNVFTSKLPQKLRAKMFKKALQTPSGSSDFARAMFSWRFDSFVGNYGLGALGNELFVLSDQIDQVAEFDKELEAVTYFYTCLVDAFNPAIVGKISYYDRSYQHRILSNLQNAQKYVHDWISWETNTEYRKIQFTKIQKMLADVQSYANLSFN